MEVVLGPPQVQGERLVEEPHSGQDSLEAVDSARGRLENLVKVVRGGVVWSALSDGAPLNGSRYLVAPRGITQWVRKLRVAGNGELHVGRRIETFIATELSDDEKPAILRAYLKRWGWEVGRFFEGVNANASEEQVQAIAPGFPVFRIS
ncbi:hypothetical protein [Nonomuraea angiospora]